MTRSMAQENLAKPAVKAETNLDTVIIDKIIETVRGGRTLETADFPDDVIQAGHVILQRADGEYIPQPTDGSIPEGAKAVGVLIGSILKSQPAAAIMTRGTVNEVPLKYPINDTTKTALGDRIGYTLTP